jgi:hypothetical protein
MLKFYSKLIGKTLLSRNRSFKQKISRFQEKIASRLIEHSYENTIECIVCSSRVELYCEILKVPYYQCSKCLHLQISRLPYSDFVQSLYTSNDLNETSQNEIYINDDSITQIRSAEIAFQKVNFILDKTEMKHSVDKLWIDIGSGIGETLHALSQINPNFKSIGFESSYEQHKKAIDYGVKSLNEIFDPNIRIYPELKEARIVSLLNVLEHVFNPVQFIKKISEQMFENNYLVVEVPKHPSISSIIQKAGMPYSYRHIYPPDHLNIFSVNSLSMLLSNFGFAITHTWFFGSDAIDLFSYVDFNINKSTEGNFEPYSQTINKLQNAIDESELSDVMLVIAKKLPIKAKLS